MKRTLLFLFLSVFSGVMISLAWPAHGIPFLSFLAFVPLLYIEQQLGGSRFKSLKFLGYTYISMVLWNFLTTYWIYYSSPEGAYMAILVNALIMAMIWWLFMKTKAILGNARGYIALIIYWTGFEYLHLDWDLSWPWLMIGNVFANYTKVIQWYEYTGVLGGTVWVLVINIMLFRLLMRLIEKKTFRQQVIRLALVILIPILASVVRYAQYTEKENPVDIVLVQPNIDPWEKFGRLKPREQMERIIGLAASKTDIETDYVICPETAIPVGVWDDDIDVNPQILDIRAFIAPYPDLRFITGMNHLQLFFEGDPLPNTATPYKKDGATHFDDHNAAIQLDNYGGKKLYFKSKLVPGPEMFPFAEVLGPMQDKLFGNLGGQIGDLGTQEERSVFLNEKSGLKAAPVICYESIYGGFITGFIRNGGNFISVSTNDAWWGDTPGYQQLLAYTRLRAIETRRSVARSANTGITCFINQRGDILQPTKYATTDVIRGTINANDAITFYVRYGDYIGRAASFSGLLLLLYIIIIAALKRGNKNAPAARR